MTIVGCNMPKKELTLEEQCRSLIMYSGLVNDICKPLFSDSGITNFAYAEIREDGNFLFLCSDPQFYTQLIGRGILPTLPLRVLRYNHHSGHYVSDLHSNDYFFTGSLLEQMAHFELGHFLITIDREVRDGVSIVKMYRYGGHFKNQKLNHFYINNFEVLQKFNKYFDKRMSNFLARQEPIKLDASYQAEFKKYYDHFENCPESTLNVFDDNREFINKLDKNTEPDIRLTQREMAVIKLYTQGLTAQQTADALSISRRTVERHFERINKKLNCTSKNQIMAKLVNAGYDIFAT